jgi:hypothetical protein
VLIRRSAEKACSTRSYEGSQQTWLKVSWCSANSELMYRPVNMGNVGDVVSGRGKHMTPDERERMNSLCVGIQEEEDYNTFVTLLRELGELIARKEQRRFKQHPKLVWQRNRPWKTVPAVVSKLVKPGFADQPEKIEISISGAEHLFREIRIENKFTGVDGALVALTNGAHVDVTFEAEAERPV